jgi:hypothetical protein
MMATGLLLLAGSAAADPAWTLGKPQVSAQLNYGIATGDIPGDINPYGIGLGVKGGYTLDASIYIGGAFDYYFGGSEETAGSEFDYNVWALQGEVGYDLGLMPEGVLRPKLGLGISSIGGELCLGDLCESERESELSIAPGVQFLYSLDSLYLTADARYNIVFADGDAEANGFILGAGAGISF